MGAILLWETPWSHISEMASSTSPVLRWYSVEDGGVEGSLSVSGNAQLLNLADGGKEVKDLTKLRIRSPTARLAA
jgi:hypothetical protein